MPRTRRIPHPPSASTAWAFEIRPGLGVAATARLPAPPPGWPAHRQLRVYAQDPTLGGDDGAVHTVSIPCEALKPGPEGALFVVLPLPVQTPVPGAPVAHGRQGEERETGAATAPQAASVSAPPVDLDAPALLMQQGLAPAAASRAFMQQMVYAVCMETYARFVRALGRDPGFGPLQGEGRDDGRLRILAMDDANDADEPNAYYDRETSRIVFGYGRAKDGGASQAGSEVYAALSRDVIAHEATHAMLDSLRPNFLRPTHRDIGGLHEGISDIVALFLRFTQRAPLERAIARSDGGLRDDLLMQIGRQFGFDLINGSRDPMRRVSVDDPYYTDIPPERRYLRNDEDHDLGQVLVSAVFDAFCAVYERSVAPLRRCFAPYQGRLPREAVEWLAGQAAKIAARFLDIAIRAVDYCPPLHCSFGEYLRAMITADHDLAGAEGAPYREILIASFRRFGVTVPDVPTLSEESLLWRPPATPIRIPQLAFGRLGLNFDRGLCDWPDAQAQREAAQALCAVLCTPAHAQDAGVMAPDAAAGVLPPMLLSLRPLRRVSSEGDVRFDLVAEIVQKRKVREGWFLGGATVVVSSAGEVRYAIAKHIDSARRLKAQREWLRGQDKDVREAAWDRHSGKSAARIARLHVARRRGADAGAASPGAADSGRKAGTRAGKKARASAKAGTDA